MRRRIPLPIFEVFAGLYDRLTDQRYWHEHIRATLAHAPEPPPTRVLDLGCGPGGSTFVLAEHFGKEVQVIGVDVAQRMIARAEHHLAHRAGLADRVRFMVADAVDLPFPEGAFDLVVGHSFLYLVPDRQGVLAEVRRVLRPKGRLVLMEPYDCGSLLRATASSIGAWGELGRHPFDAARFATCMVLWRVVSLQAGRLSTETVRELFGRAGLQVTALQPTLGGLGLHCVGEAS